MDRKEGGDEGKEGWEVILRGDNDRRVVLYHAEDKQLVVKGKSRGSQWRGFTDRFSSTSVPSLSYRVERNQSGGEGGGGSGSNRTEGGGGGGGGGDGTECPLCGGTGANVAVRRNVPMLTDGREMGGPRKSFIATDYFRLLESSAQNESTTEEVENDDVLGSGALNQGYYARFFVEERRVGSGANGSVFLCQHMMDGVQLGRYGVKKIPVGNNHTWLVNMLREVRILESLHHPNIIEYKHTWLEKAQLSQFGVEVPCLFVLMEYANAGNLAQYLQERDSSDSDANGLSYRKRSQNRSEKRRRVLRRLRKMNAGAEGSQMHTNAMEENGPTRILPESLVWRFFMDMLSGLDYLHRHGIVHRDIKPQNLLLHLEENDTVPRVLLSDFGECEYLSRLNDRKRTGYTGTMEYVAPEMLEMDVRGRFSRKYDKRCDIWSLGVVLFQLATGHLPWNSSESDALTSEILATGKSRSLFPPLSSSDVRRSPEMRLLIENMLIRDPDGRPTTGNLVELVSSYMSTPGRAPPSPLINAQAMRDTSEMEAAQESMDPLPLLLESEPVVLNSAPIGMNPAPILESVALELVPKAIEEAEDYLWTEITLPTSVKMVTNSFILIGKVQSCSHLCTPYQTAALLTVPIICTDLLSLSFRCNSSVFAGLALLQAIWLLLLLYLEESCVTDAPSFSSNSTVPIIVVLSLSFSLNALVWLASAARRKRRR